MQPTARITDPVTSHEAAATISNQASVYNAVLLVLERLGNATDEELWRRYHEERSGGLSLPTVSPSGLRSRRNELVTMGLVRDTQRTRRTSSGRRAIVWAPSQTQEQP
jgi:hypothetical protein